MRVCLPPKVPIAKRLLVGYALHLITGQSGTALWLLLCTRHVCMDMSIGSCEDSRLQMVSCTRREGPSASLDERADMWECVHVSTCVGAQLHMVASDGMHARVHVRVHTHTHPRARMHVRMHTGVPWLPC